MSRPTSYHRREFLKFLAASPHVAAFGGVDDNATLRANRDGFKHVELRPRRLRDATKVDMHVDLLGTVYDSPIFTCPVGEAHVRWDRHEWSAHFRSFDGLEFRRSHAQILERQIYHQGHRHARGCPAMP